MIPQHCVCITASADPNRIIGIHRETLVLQYLLRRRRRRGRVFSASDPTVLFEQSYRFTTLENLTNLVDRQNKPRQIVVHPTVTPRLRPFGWYKFLGQKHG